MFKLKVIGSKELRKISIKDNGEKLVDTKLFCPGLKFDIAFYIIKPEERIRARFVRKSIAEMINKAIGYLPKEYTFILRCGLRSLGAQKIGYEKEMNRLKKLHPKWNIQEIEDKLDEIVAPVDLAPHCTGGAIDIFLVDKKRGGYIDIECEPGERTERAYTYSDKISEKAKKNREVFIKALTKAGLNNFPGEIWHWSYGETDWAAYQKKPYAIL